MSRKLFGLAVRRLKRLSKIEFESEEKPRGHIMSVFQN